MTVNTPNPTIAMDLKAPEQATGTATGGPVFPVARAAGMLGMTVAVAGTGCWAVLALAMGDRTGAMHSAIASVTCGVAGLLGLLPVWLLSRSMGMQGAATGFLGGMLLRMGLAGAVVLVAQARGYPEARGLGLWVVGWYLVVLTTEVLLLSSYLRSASAAKVRAGGPADRLSQCTTETDR